MAKSSRRRKQDRAKAGAKRAEQARRRARLERARQQSEHYGQLLEPRTSPDEVARLVAEEMAGTLAAGAIARVRLSAGVPAGELAETARLLTSTPEAPGLGTLAFAAVAAHAVGDEDGEHRHTAELFARAEAENDDGLRLEVIRMIVAIGHLGEAIELIEPYLLDSPDDEQAAEIYAAAMEKARQDAEPGERERAALDRFADRSGLVALRDAIGGYLGRTKWGDIVGKHVEKELARVADEDWAPAGHEAFAALAFEYAVDGATEHEGEKDLDELIERDLRDGSAETALSAFAADPAVPRALASQASTWRKHAHCGVWQLADPVARPGVWCTDLVSGTTRYVEFPAAALDGAPPWTVWLGTVGPVDGIWRSAPAGVRLSPDEGDAVAEYADRAVRVIAKLMTGVPRGDLAAPGPVRFGSAEPYGARWDYEEPEDANIARFTSSVTSGLVTHLAVEVAQYRAKPPRPRDSTLAAAGAEGSWLDQQVPALGGLTPREAADGDAADLIMLESLLRQLEYQSGLAVLAGKKGIDVARLRTELDMPSTI